jgi:Holliday junction resolvase
MALESTITKSIVASAKSRGWWTFKIAGGPMQMAGVPDLLCVKRGFAVFLEVKQPGKKPTAIQEQRIHEIRTIGGAVAEVVTSKAEAERILDEKDHSGMV